VTFKLFICKKSFTFYKYVLKLAYDDIKCKYFTGWVRRGRG